jgi:hypothetical protein
MSYSETSCNFSKIRRDVSVYNLDSYLRISRSYSNLEAYEKQMLAHWLKDAQIMEQQVTIMESAWIKLTKISNESTYPKIFSSYKCGGLFECNAALTENEY